MSILEEARGRLKLLIGCCGVDTNAAVQVYPLSPDDAIGERAGEEFVIRRGKERVIEAVFDDVRGQAFTDSPLSWEGSLASMLNLDLFLAGNRAIFVAGMNAVAARLKASTGAIHCRNEDPRRCGPVIAAEICRRFGKKRIALIGLQPAILESCVQHFGDQNVSVVDLNPDNVGTEKFGVRVADGDTGFADILSWCEIGLCTGSTVVNGTIDDVIRGFQVAHKPVVFFGNTASAVASLLKLDRICPFSR